MQKHTRLEAGNRPGSGRRRAAQAAMRRAKNVHGRVASMHVSGQWGFLTGQCVPAGQTGYPAGQCVPAGQIGHPAGQCAPAGQTGHPAGQCAPAGRAGSRTARGTLPFPAGRNALRQVSYAGRAPGSGCAAARGRGPGAACRRHNPGRGSAAGCAGRRLRQP